MKPEDISLRDWFAGQVASGMSAAALPFSPHGRKVIAEHAYEVADELLAERAKNPGEDPYASVREFANFLRKQRDASHSGDYQDTLDFVLVSLNEFCGIKPSEEGK